MAYIDLTKLSDIHAQNIISEDPAKADLALKKAEVDTRVTARENEVKSEDIPVTDPDGYIVSEMLYMYCEWRFLYHIFRSVGGSFEIDDIYGQKMLEAKHEAQLTKDNLTKSIITEEEVTEPKKRNQGIAIL